MSSYNYDIESETLPESQVEKIRDFLDQNDIYIEGMYNDERGFRLYTGEISASECGSIANALTKIMKEDNCNAAFMARFNGDDEGYEIISRSGCHTVNVAELIWNKTKEHEAILDGSLSENFRLHFNVSIDGTNEMFSDICEMQEALNNDTLPAWYCEKYNVKNENEINDHLINSDTAIFDFKSHFEKGKIILTDDIGKNMSMDVLAQTISCVLKRAGSNQIVPIAFSYDDASGTCGGQSMVVTAHEIQLCKSTEEILREAVQKISQKRAEACENAQVFPN